MSNIRKHIIFLSILFTFILGGCTGSFRGDKQEYKIKSGKDITFYTVTDLHYLSDSLTDNGEAFNKFLSTGDGKQLQYIGELLDAFTFNIKKTKPEVLIISGDLTNNGEKESHLELAKRFQSIEESGTSIYVIPGNYDISNPWARGFKADKQYITDSISAKDFSRIYANFGYDEAISKDKDSLSYLAAPSEDAWLLMLDTNKYKDNTKLGVPQAEGELSKDTLNWIKECSNLAREKGANIITVMHHNILDHSDVIREGYTLNNNEEALNVFKENKLNLVLSGHIHIQDICSDNRDGAKLYDVVTNSLAIYPHQQGILKYSAKDSSFDYSTKRVDVEGWSKAKGILDENLNSFAKYSEDYFGKFAYNMAYKEFIGDINYTEDQIESMSETVKILNLRYFAGIENLNSKDIVNSEGFRLLVNSPEGFLKRYALSISSDKDTDDNKLHIKLQAESSGTK